MQELQHEIAEQFACALRKYTPTQLEVFRSQEMERMAQKMQQHFKESSDEAQARFNKVEALLDKIKKKVEKQHRSKLVSAETVSG